MSWCERCLCDHDGQCLDESMQHDLSKTLNRYFREEVRDVQKHPHASEGVLRPKEPKRRSG